MAVNGDDLNKLFFDRSVFIAVSKRDIIPTIKFSQFLTSSPIMIKEVTASILI